MSKNNTLSTVEILPSSFRDPSGFVFEVEDQIYRQINLIYKNDFETLTSSGLYQDLVDDGLLIPHKEIDLKADSQDKPYKTIKPERIPFISYPFEWSFSQLKDSALATLQIQKRALEFGMSLKDCSAYNIQFRNGKPTLLDTLSFERYREGEPWIAYKQFCQHFLAPLALMSHVDVRLNQLLRIYIDGVPMNLASSLLPTRTRFHFSLLTHIHLHAKSQMQFGNNPIKAKERKVSFSGLRGLIDNLESAVRKLAWHPGDTEWADYYEDTNYSEDAFKYKKELVTQFLHYVNPEIVWDLGANMGVFSRIASDRGIQTISFDIDPAAVEKNYLRALKNHETAILPLVIDLTNPSPDMGWENQERMSLFTRGPGELVMALALIHHLAISNNVPLHKIASMFHKLCKFLIIEFVPKSDSQVQRLLKNRSDIFPTYKQSLFESAFQQYFQIKKSIKIKETERTLYLMEKRDSA